jgi:NDP-4-keto-2,6-dideoxyhexose 3-C-methyltransferase
LGPDLIEGIAERQPQKYGLLTAGSWIPIISEEEMRQRKPDYLFVLPWHFMTEFIDREQAFLEGGGKFIVPLPALQVIS